MTQPARQPADTPPAQPQHVAIIMDGNSRWARERGVSRAIGHNQGGEAIRALVKACRSRPYIRYLTLYAFSIENWRRSAEEVGYLMSLVRHFIRREAHVLGENNIRLRFIGQFEYLDDDIRRDLTDLETLTENNTALTLAIALSYGARQELRAATQAIAAKVARGELSPDAIDEATVTAHLSTADLPDPDLLIRTGGDMRLSNFLLWQSAYTELYFDPVLWPDYSPEHLDRAVDAFGQRERRFGQRNEA